MQPTGGPRGGQSPYLAREPELDRLRRRLELARDGHGGLLIVNAPAGSGVTRTAHEIAAFADRLGMLVLWGRWQPGTVGRPYGAVADALEEYGLSLGPDALAEELGEWSAPLIRLAPRLGSLLRELTPAAPLSAADERLRLERAVLGLLAHASARQPLLLVLDDAQWADGDALRLLEYVLPRARQLPLLIVAGRAEMPAVPEFAPDPHAEAGWQALRATGLVDEVVELGGIDAAAIAALLGALADEPLSTDAVALIHGVSGGLPLHARELYRHLREENRLDRIRGRGLPAVSDLPDSFEDLVAWRISRLSPEMRSTLTALAAFDDGASPDVIAAIGRLSRARVTEFLDVAAGSGLSRPIDGATRHSLAHDRLRAALLLALSPIQRAHLHRQVAETLDTELADQAREAAGTLLHHYQLSAQIEDGARGVRHALVAAGQARAAYSHLRAARCLAAGLGLVPPHDHRMRADLGFRLADAQAEAGLRPEAVSTASAAVLQQRQAGVRPDEIVASLITTLRLLRGDALDDAMLPGEELWRLALEHVGRAGPEQRARLDLLAAHWEELRGDGVATLYWDVPRGGQPTALDDRSADRDTGELLLPQRARTRERTAQVAGFARSWRQPSAVLGALRAVTVDLATRHGLFPEAAGWARLYLETARRYGALRHRVAALLLLARCEAVVGRLPAASATLDEGRDLLREIPAPGHLVPELLLTWAVVAHYLDGEWDALASDLAVAVEDPRPAGLALSAELALARARLGARETALELLPGLFELCAKLEPLTYYRDTALLATLTAAWELGAGEYAAGGRALIALPAAANVASQPHATPRLARARLYGLLGDMIEARPLFAEERAVLDGSGLAPLRAIVDHDEAVVLAASGPSAYTEAVTLLERAATQFESLGMTGWRQRADELLAGGFEAAAAPGGRLHFTYPQALSKREADVVRLVATGATAAEAAAALAVDAGAAERHLAAALEKLGAGSVDELAAAARRHGLAPGG